MANRSTRCGIRLVLAGGAFGTFAALRALDDTFGGCWPPSLWMLGRGKLPQHVLRVRSCSKLAAALDYNSTAEARGSRLHSTYDTKRTSNTCWRKIRGCSPAPAMAVMRPRSFRQGSWCAP